VEKVVHPGEVIKEKTGGEESLQRGENGKMDYIPCENVLLSSSGDKITFPGRSKRKRTEDGESQQNKKRKSLDPIPCDNELPSTSEDTGKLHAHMLIIILL